MSRAASRPRVLVIGAGLAGLAAAIEATELGADVVLAERCAEPGGATIASAGWIWAYHDLDAYREMAPAGDERVQRALVDGFDPAIAWLERHAVDISERGTGRTFTRGVRVNPQALVATLVACLPPGVLRAATRVTRVERDGSGELCARLEHAGRSSSVNVDAVIAAGGGYAADVARIAREAHAEAHRDRWVVRPARGGDGSSMDAIAPLGVERVHPDGECFTRLVPDVAAAPVRAELSIPFGELGGVEHVVIDAVGAEVARLGHDWSGAMQAWELARRTGAGWIRLPSQSLDARVHAGGVRDIVERAIELGVPARRADDGSIALAVVAGVTHTRCGIVVDGHGAAHGSPSVYAAGADAADAGMGGTAGGLAQALVLGLEAARAAVRDVRATTTP